MPAIESEKKTNEIFNCDLNYIDLILSTDQGFNIKKGKMKLKKRKVISILKFNIHGFFCVCERACDVKHSDC